MSSTGLRIGVWLDHAHAHVVEIKSDGSTHVTTIESGVEPLSRTTGHVHNLPAHGMGGGLGDREHKHTEERRHQQTSAYFDRLTKAVASAQEILVLGSGGAPEEFARVLRDNASLASRVRGVEHTDRLTAPQLTALVLERFGKAPGRISAT